MIVIESIAYDLRLSGGRIEVENYSSMRHQRHTKCTLICIIAHHGAYKCCVRQTRGFAGHWTVPKICEKWVLQEPLTYLTEEITVTINDV